LPVRSFSGPQERVARSSPTTTQREDGPAVGEGARKKKWNPSSPGDVGLGPLQGPSLRFVLGEGVTNHSVPEGSRFPLKTTLSHHPCKASTFREAAGRSSPSVFRPLRMSALTSPSGLPGVTIQTVLNSHLDHSRDTDLAPPPVQSVDLDVWDVKVVLRDADDSVYPDLVDLKT